MLFISKLYQLFWLLLRFSYQLADQNLSDSELWSNVLVQLERLLGCFHDCINIFRSQLLSMPLLGSPAFDIFNSMLLLELLFHHTLGIMWWLRSFVSSTRSWFLYRLLLIIIHEWALWLFQQSKIWAWRTALPILSGHSVAAYAVPMSMDHVHH